MTICAAFAAALAILPSVSFAVVDEARCRAGACALAESDADEIGLLQRGLLVEHAAIPKDSAPLDSEVQQLQDSEVPKLLDNLRESPGWQALRAALATSTCTMDGSGGGCPLRTMLPGQVVDVYPGEGSGTACLDSSSYYFQVRRGATDKLLLYFQGGGACWDRMSFKLGGCFKNATPTGFDGILDASDSNNPYFEYSLVHVLYCSGDMHAGNTTQPWGPDKTDVPIRGYNNANSAVRWALREFEALSDVVFAGCSAGSLGVQMWSHVLQNEFRGRSSTSTTIADSFAGVLYPPRQVQEGQSFLYDVWSMCGLPLLSDEEQALCRSNRLLLDEHFLSAMSINKLAKFAMINSDADIVQRDFARAFMLSALDSIIGFLMTAEQYYQYWNVMVEKYVKEHNFNVYAVNGEQHCFTNTQFVYTTTPLGKDGGGSGPVLSEWIGGVSAGTAARAVCEGTLEKVSPLPPAINNTDYCDKAIMAVN